MAVAIIGRLVVGAPLIVLFLPALYGSWFRTKGAYYIG